MFLLKLKEPELRKEAQRLISKAQEIATGSLEDRLLSVWLSVRAWNILARLQMMEAQREQT